MIDYSDVFFKPGDPIIKKFGFLKRFGTLYGLLIDLLSEEISTLKAAKEQDDMLKKQKS